MSQPETDADYRARILKVASEEDRGKLYLLYGKALDAMGRRYDKYRWGAVLFEEPKKENSDVATT